MNISNSSKYSAMAIRSAIDEMIVEGREAFLVNQTYPEYGYGCGICYALFRKIKKMGIDSSVAYHFMNSFINCPRLYENGLGEDGHLNDLRIWTILLLDQLTVEEIQFYLDCK